MRQLLQNDTENGYQKFITRCIIGLLQSASGITKCDSYYKVKRNNSISANSNSNSICNSIVYIIK